MMATTVTMRRSARAWVRPAAVLVVVLAAAALVSCMDILNTLLDTAAPLSLSASDGEYGNRIEVDWSAPSLSGEKWVGKSITGYVVEWSGPASGSADLSADQTSFALSVGLVNRAKLYTVTVTSVVNGEEEDSSSDTGFALETYDLVWPDGGSEYSFTGAERWYVTMLQEGFSYDFQFLDGNSGWLEFYDYETLEPLLHATGNTGLSGASSTLSWVCDEDGNWHKFYVRVVSAAANTRFFARYGF
jgi:hypothetical protein